MKPVKWYLAISAAMTFSTVNLAAESSPALKPSYNEKLATKLGGDEFGMRHYVFVILKTGPNDANFKDKARADLFAGHMANIGRLAEQGKLAVAGPFSKNDKGFHGGVGIHQDLCFGNSGNRQFSLLG